MSAASTVAVIGAGPAGLAAARWLLAQGLEPVLLEASDGVGGQWRATNPLSGVWSDMRTNTSRVVTGFSDLDYPPGTAMFPHNREVLAYLEAYAARFGLDRRLRAGCAVERLERAPGGWRLQWREADGVSGAESFARVVVASGRYNHPAVPQIDGLNNFAGSGGVVHTFDYSDPAAYRGRRVLVAGGAISALEVASDIALAGASSLAVACRRQRYVMPKMASGVPADSRFSRYGAVAAETLPADEIARRLKAWILKAAANPARHGAAAPADDVREAGVALSQDFLPLLAEGRITTRPWLQRVSGTTVTFTDGAAEDFDAIVLGSGFHLRIPFLGEDIRRALDLDDQHIDLADFTFHPELEGLAFVGMIPQTGPYFPVLELQARYLAYAWSGACAPPSREAMAAGVEAYRAARSGPLIHPMHAVALRFARLAGVEPDPRAWPGLERALLFGPLTAMSFRLQGPDALPDAAETIARDGVAHRTADGPAFTARERALLREIAEASADPRVQAWGGLA
ncbi:MAG TPA: FAD-dependent oxidoreductase [Caulobacteraceae bacterium]